ncbi:MAG: hypothetical protein CK425_06190 [Parachlamydia sp.]|nr:MAG: hypothetical protein CK425_06190 [Parachlamydia sp.]
MLSIDSNLVYYKNQIDFEHSFEEYAKKMRIFNQSPPAQELYGRILVLLKNYGLKASGYQESLVRLDTPVLDPSSQKKIALKKIEQVQEQLKELGIELVFSDLSFLSLEQICELTLVSCFLHTYELSCRGSKPSKESFFTTDVYDLLVKKEWDKGALEYLTKFCKDFHVSETLKEKLHKIFVNIKCIGCQKNFLPFPLEELGFPPASSECKMPKEVFTWLTILYTKMHLLLNQTSLPLKRLFDGMKIAPLYHSTLYPRGAAFEAFFPTIEAKFKAFRHVSTTRNSIGLSRCKVLAKTPSRRYEVAMQISQLVKSSPSKFEKTLVELLENAREGLDGMLPGEKHARTKKNTMIRCAFDGFHHLICLWKIKETLSIFFEALEENLHATTYLKASQDCLLFFTYLKESAEKALKPVKQPKHQAALNRQFFNEFMKKASPWFSPIFEKMAKAIEDDIPLWNSSPDILMQDFSDRLFNTHTPPNPNPPQSTLNLRAGIFEDLEMDLSSKISLSQTTLNSLISVETLFEEILDASIFSMLMRTTNTQLLNPMTTMLENAKNVVAKNSKDQILIIAQQNQLSEMNAALETLESFRQVQNICFAWLRPFIIEIPAFQAQDESWLLDVDREAKSVRYKKIKKKKEKLAKNPAAEKVESEKTLSHPASKTQRISKTPSNRIEKCPEKFYPAHLIHQIQTLDEAAIFALDQQYHFQHCLWTLELLQHTLKKGMMPQASLLSSTLINHLYLAQEQGITPLYLSKTHALHHGLVAMSHELEIPCERDNDMGSTWFRYPHASLDFHTFRSQTPPLGLEILLACNDGFTESSLGHLTSLLNHSLTHLKALAKLQKDFDMKPIKQMQEQCKQLMELELEEYPLEPFSNLSPLQLELHSLYERLKAKLKTEQKQHPERKVNSLKDLCVHLKRMITALEMMDQFPEQKFLSLHEHILRTCGQCLLEIAFSAISNINGEEFHSHNFKVATAILGLEDELAMIEAKKLKESNIEKAGDYLFWAALKSKIKGRSTHPGLLHLSEAHHLSMYAEIFGKGFLPAGYSQDTLVVKKKHLLNLVQAQLAFLTTLAERRIL